MVIDNNPDITTWAVGGHSFAATGVCWYVYNKDGAFTNSSKIKGVVLWAGIPDPSQPINDKPVKALSLWATNNPKTNEEVINSSKPNLPPDTYFIALQGANHAQFGWYGDQSGDNPATISREDQQEQIVQATAALLALLK